MGYHHKRKRCAEKAEESLENVLEIERSEYALMEAAETVLIRNPMQDILIKEAATNVLPDEANDLLRREAGAKIEVTTPSMEEIDTIEEYETAANIEFEIDEEKDGYCKKRKGKNVLKLGYKYHEQ
ncbi:hypothetical protein EU538_01705 [Candidatus Thorarchaeota archaeon]|jgi:hypothetical protein|nr:MAG: hypothetical protein EU538_01705 [Candidatus Thorarchaeota archaeon]